MRSIPTWAATLMAAVWLAASPGVTAQPGRAAVAPALPALPAPTPLPGGGAPECIAPAKPGGGFDQTCKLAQAAFQQAGLTKAPMRIGYMPGGVGAIAFDQIVTRRPAEPGTLVAFSSGSLLNLSHGRFGKRSVDDVRWNGSGGLRDLHGGERREGRTGVGGGAGGGGAAGGRRRSAGRCRRAAARRRDRRDAGDPGVGPGAAAALVGGHLRDVRAESLGGDGGAGGAGVRGVLRVSAGADRRPARGAR